MCDPSGRHGSYDTSYDTRTATPRHDEDYISPALDLVYNENSYQGEKVLDRRRGRGWWLVGGRTGVGMILVVGLSALAHGAPCEGHGHNKKKFVAGVLMLKTDPPGQESAQSDLSPPVVPAGALQPLSIAPS